MQKEHILAEIRRTAQENDGKPLGKSRFERTTGIKEYDWQKFWPRFSEAQQEAGFIPNQFKIDGHDDQFLIESIIGLTRELNRFPVKAEMRIKKRNDPSFPNDSTITRRFANKSTLITKVVEFCKANPGYDDVLELFKPAIEVNGSDESKTLSFGIADRFGEVYLFKSGRYYKIGMTRDIARRGSELKVLLPEKMDLIHSIKTDDPSGIEAYWHKRFEAKRMNGEWFDLTPADIRAFKRWRKIY